MTPHVKRLLAGAICTLIASVHPMAAQDSGPVTRPQSEPSITDRLPAPKPSAKQEQDGQIYVSWAPVEGAVSYRMWRSVPPAPTAPVTLRSPQSPGYVDADIKTGSTYYYVVAAVGAGGIEGLRGGTAPVTATRSVSTSITTAPTVTARIEQQDPLRIGVSFTGEGVRWEIERTEYSSPSADSAQIDYTRPLGPIRLVSPSLPFFGDPLPSRPYARSVSYTVRAVLATGSMSPPGKGDVVVPAATSTTTGDSTTGGNTGPATTGGTTTTGGTAGTAPTVTAKLERQDPLQVLVSYGVANGRNYEVERTMYRSRSADPSQIDYSSPMNTTRWTLADTTLTDSYLMYPDAFARSVSYAVRANMWDGTVTPIGKSSVLILPASGSTTTSAAAVAGLTTFTVAAPATVKNGATTSLAASIGSPARWVSLNESVATVDASGTVTGRLAGNTRIVALATSSDGSLRVVAIPLTVSP